MDRFSRRFPIARPGNWLNALVVMKNLKITLLLLTVATATFSSSCATTKGFGQDLQKVGNRLESRADATGGAEPVSAAPSSVPPAY